MKTIIAAALLVVVTATGAQAASLGICKPADGAGDWWLMASPECPMTINKRGRLSSDATRCYAASGGYKEFRGKLTTQPECSVAGQFDYIRMPGPAPSPEDYKTQCEYQGWMSADRSRITGHLSCKRADSSLPPTRYQAEFVRTK